MIPQYEPLIDRETLATELFTYAKTDGFFTEFRKTEEFEKSLASFLDVKHCSVVNNGTISLSLALLAGGIKPGQRVLVPNITMIATSAAVRLIGAKPVFVDVDPKNLCMNLDHAQAHVFRSDVHAVIYVTLNGRSHSFLKLKEFYEFCKNHNVFVVEDNAQSLGSTYAENFSLNLKISCPPNGIGSFSFSMPKIITTGQGGCLVTNDETLSQRIKHLKDFGRDRGGVDIHSEFGINSKFTEPQAIMGLNQLRDINARIEAKKRIYSTYYANLNIPEVKFLDTLISKVPEYTPWFVDIYVPDREELQRYLLDKGIRTRMIYPELTSQKANHTWLGKKSLPISSKYTKSGLWLPSSMSLTTEQIVQICATIKEFYG